MSTGGIKRFWAEATVEPAGSGFEIRLDGRPVRTPAKAPLEVPTAELAGAIASEWMGQRETVDPATMPLTRAANAAIDKVTPQFEAVADAVAGYGDSDLLCYRAAYPDGLIARQAAAWDPLIDWAATELGAPLSLVSGVMHRPQPRRSLDVLSAHVRALGPFELTALHDLVGLSGSLVVGLAVTRGWEPAAELWDRSRIDEDWQIAEWGEDAEAAQEARSRRRAFLHAAAFFALVRGQAPDPG